MSTLKENKTDLQPSELLPQAAVNGRFKNLPLNNFQRMDKDGNIWEWTIPFGQWIKIKNCK